MSFKNKRSFKYFFVFTLVLIILPLILSFKLSSAYNEHQLSRAGIIAPGATWIVNGNEKNIQYGFVNFAGDVNGDGYDDVLVGEMPYYSSMIGHAYSYYGSETTLPTTPNWIATNNIPGAQFGNALPAGDINADGFDDVIVGSRYYSYGEEKEGIMYLYYGSESGLNSSFHWSYESDNVNANLGWGMINSSGDINSDGFSDILISAINYDNEKGRVYVFYGSRSGLSSFPNWTFTGDQEGARLGKASILGDVNGDGFLDIGIGAEFYDNGQTDEGKIYIFYGSESGLNLDPDWVVESNLTNGRWGKFVAPVGDINGDGYADIGIGSDYYGAGEGYIFLGSLDGPSNSPDLTMPYGDWINTVGDLDRDGYTDFIIGEPWYSSATGGTWIYFGAQNLLDIFHGWSTFGEVTGSHFGWPAGSVGDVNKDNANEVMIGAHAYPNYQRYGAAYFYLGIPNDDPVTVPFFSQYDEKWASEDYASGTSTIGELGCFMTSCTMIINYWSKQQQAAFRTNPQILNEWLNNNQGYLGDLVVPSKIPEYAKQLGIDLSYEQRTYGINNEILDSYLESGKPVIIGVNFDGVKPTHWVVATGKTTVNNEETYIINDPLDMQGETTLAEKYDNEYHSIVKYIPIESDDNRNLQISAHSPVEFVVTDPLNRKSGYDPITETHWDDIPETDYEIFAMKNALEPSLIIEAKVLEIDIPLDGQYTISIYGTGDGEYTVYSLAIDKMGQTERYEFNGIAYEGSINIETFDYSENFDLSIKIHLPFIIK